MSEQRVEQTYLVQSIFGPTIQGEGPLMGTKTNFIRLAGCDYRCTWCDSMVAVDPIHRATWRTFLPSLCCSSVRPLGP